jgi:short-subunit dehydrogenase
MAWCRNPISTTAASKVRQRRAGGLPPAPGHIVITGASSGLGAALALEYAGPGVCLALTGRNRERLTAVAQACRDAGATRVSTACLEVSEAAPLAAWLHAVEAEQPVELIIANAGIAAGPGSGGGGEEPAQVRRIFAVNVDGTLNTVLPLLPALRARGRGQIALMSSLAGFRGLPGAPAYCASKAALRVWGEGLRCDLAPLGIGVSVICPGFVATPMTAVNPFPMPFLMDAARAARIIRRGLDRNRARIAFPWPTSAAVWLLNALPPAWIDPWLRTMPRKPGCGGPEKRED